VDLYNKHYNKGERMAKKTSNTEEAKKMRKEKRDKMAKKLKKDFPILNTKVKSDKETLKDIYGI
jgi:hypothetical protein